MGRAQVGKTEETMAIVLCRRLTQGALHARWLTDWMNAILGDALSTFIIST